MRCPWHQHQFKNVSWLNLPYPSPSCSTCGVGSLLPRPVSWDALNGRVEEVTLKSSDGFLPSLIIKLCANQSQLCLFLNMFIPVVVVIIIM